jgi:hypothetical protein
MMMITSTLRFLLKHKCSVPKLTLAHTSIELKTEAAEWAVEEEEGVSVTKALPIQ